MPNRNRAGITRRSAIEFHAKYVNNDVLSKEFLIYSETMVNIEWEIRPSFTARESLMLNATM
jgi:hypothetical protein